MPPIAAHSTSTSPAEWDGPANEARLRRGEDAGYYASAAAWVDLGADPATKEAYRFVHHLVGPDGTIGAASTRAVLAGIACLNGARGGNTIPPRDRDAVWRHLAKHLRDAGLEAPPLRAMSRGTPLHLREYPWEVAAEERATPGPIITGYAAVYDALSGPMFGIREKIARGAFARSLAGTEDIIALWQHDTAQVLGSRSAGTLKIEDTDRGLRVEIHPPNAAAWPIESIRRGDVRHMSIGFFPVRESTGREDGKPIRVLEEVKLREVSPVTFPAYPATEVEARAALAALGLTPQDIWEMADSDTSLADSDAGMVGSMPQRSPDAAPAAGHHSIAVNAVDSEPAARAAHHLRVLVDLLQREADATKE